MTTHRTGIYYATRHYAGCTACGREIRVNDLGSLSQYERDWIAEHCGFCGDDYETCECDDPRPCGTAHRTR